MKHLFTTAVLVMISVFGLLNTGTAQAKIGYISTEELIGLMPEAEKANSTLQEYQGSLQEQGVEYYKEYMEKDSIFRADSAKFSQTIKELKIKDLNELGQKVQGWSQSMQQLMQQKTQELLAPIRSKAFETIKTVAKESGYTYVIDAQAILVGPPGDDILPLVKKKLGIKDAPAAQPKPKQ
jgi:outer membrane protein